MADWPEIRFPSFLLELVQDMPRRLRVIVEERSGFAPEEDAGPLGASRLIVSDPSDGRFEIVWNNFVVYAVQDDGFPRSTEGPRTSLTEITMSEFMDFVGKSAITDPSYIAVMDGKDASEATPLRHWRFVCNEQTIDVASADPPIVRRVGNAVDRRVEDKWHTG